MRLDNYRTISKRIFISYYSLYQRIT